MVDLGTEDGSGGDGVEGFIGDGGVFLPHEVALGACHGFVPGFLLVIEGDVVVFLEGGEVFGCFPVAGGLATFEAVFVLAYPAKEEEFEVEGGEGLADHVHGGDGEGVVESVLAALVGGFFDKNA